MPKKLKMALQNDIAKRVKHIRETLLMTQKDFAAKFFLTERAIQEWEGGRRHIPDRKLLIIANYFDINREWLLHGIGDMWKKGSDFALLAEIIDCVKIIVPNWTREEQYKQASLLFEEIKKGTLTLVDLKKVTYIFSKKEHPLPAQSNIS